MASVFAIEPAYKHDESDVTYMPVTAGQTFLTGALVVITTGALVECGANPTVINGIALAPASVGLAAAGSIYGGTNIPVLVLQPDTIVKMSSTTTPAFATHIAVANPVFGVTKQGAAPFAWQLDTSKFGSLGTPATGRFIVVGVGPVQTGAGQPSVGPEFFLCKLLPQFNTLTAIVS